MAKVSILGSAAVITSSAKFEDLKTIEKYRPCGLTLYGGEDGKDPVFAVTTGAPCDLPGYMPINNNGVVFSQKSNDGNGFAQLTLHICCEAEDVKEWLADKIGGALVQLNKVEEKIPAILEEIQAEKANILSQIEVVA